MEFDKSKILTVVTADQLRECQLGWTNDRVNWLKKDVETTPPYLVETPNDGYYSTEFPFYDSKSCCHRRYFYPAPEPTYAERQAEWIKENNVKVGMKVRFTKDFYEGADGSGCCEHRDAKGKKGFVNEIFNTYISVVVYGDYWVCPFTALEVIKEPTYGERQEEWVKKHNLKEGDKVKILRTAKGGEDGWCNGWVQPMTDMVGGVFTCVRTSGDGIRLSCGYEWPYFVLDVVKEPTYRPYNNDELNDLVGEVLTNKQSGRRKLVTGKPTASEGVNLDGSYISAKDLLASFYRNTDKPCGVREEA